MMTTHNRVVQL